MMRIAFSTSCAFRSGSFISAISRTCARVTFPTFSRNGSPEPLAILAARLRSTDAGGVRSSKVRERSAKTVITAGMIRPCLSCVRALNALQNSMMFTPCWPSAGPTGGEGFACPAGHCSLTTATIFFAMSALRLLHVRVVEDHGGRAPEDLHHHPELLLLRHHLVDEAREVRERPVHDADVLALLEHDLRLGLGRPLLDLLR